MYEGAEGTDVQEADFSVIHGNDFSNVPLAALQAMQNMPGDISDNHLCMISLLTLHQNMIITSYTPSSTSTC